jgi:hypothetical protein
VTALLVAQAIGRIGNYFNYERPLAIRAIVSSEVLTRRAAGRGFASLPLLHEQRQRLRGEGQAGVARVR